MITLLNGKERTKGSVPNEVYLKNVTRDISPQFGLSCQQINYPTYLKEIV